MSIRTVKRESVFKNTILHYKPDESQTYKSKYIGIKFMKHDHARFDTFSIEFDSQFFGYGIKIDKTIQAKLLRRLKNTIGIERNTEVIIKLNSDGHIIEFGNRKDHWFRLRDFQQFDCEMKAPPVDWQDSMSMKGIRSLEEQDKMIEKLGWKILDTKVEE